nr:PREDICTED: zinc finger protein 648 [Rhinolophus sinicus]
MAQVDPQDRWGEVSSLSSFPEEPLKMTMALESEDEDGGEAEDERGTGGPERQAHPRGSFQVAQDHDDGPGRQPPCQEEEDFSDSFSTRDVGKKPMAMPGKRASEGRGESKTTPTQDSPGAPTAPGALPAGLSHKLLDQMQFPRDSLPAGDGGDLRTNLEAALGVPYSFPGPGRSFCTQSGVDTSRDNASPLCVPKPGTGPKGQSLVGAGGQGAARPYKCLRGGRAFQKPSSPLSSAQTPGAKPYPCEVCGKAYSHRGTLQQHRRLHTGERPYQCPFCDKAYTWSSDHRKHIRTHTGEKPYPCPDCGKAFVRSSDLRKHQRNMHGDHKPFRCAQCSLTFNKPLSLLRHQRAHLGEKPFRCPACDREFAVASRMLEHQRVHSGERPFRCPTCGKCFTKSSNLLEHQTLHSGQRPFKCADCGVAFAQPSRLARHQRIHTGERPFPCAQCGQAFARSSTLKRHQQVHSGEKGFLCAQCGRAFRIASELAQHIRVHNGERPYQCDDCGQAFTRSNHLQRHRAKHGTCKKEPIPSSSDD